MMEATCSLSSDEKKKSKEDRLKRVQNLCASIQAEQRKRSSLERTSPMASVVKKGRGQRDTYKIKLGWQNYKDGRYRVVTKAKGGETRIMPYSFGENITVEQIKKEALDYYFPDGISGLNQKMEEYNFSIALASGKVIESLVDKHSNPCSFQDFLKANGLYASQCHIYLRSKAKESRQVVVNGIPIEKEDQVMKVKFSKIKSSLYSEDTSEVLCHSSSQCFDLSDCLDKEQYNPFEDGFVVIKMEINNTIYLERDTNNSLIYNCPETFGQELILNGPNQVFGFEGDTLLLGVVTIWHNNDYMYKWWKDGDFFCGGINRCLINVSQTGTYHVSIVSNLDATTLGTSDTVRIDLNPLPTFNNNKSVRNAQGTQFRYHGLASQSTGPDFSNLLNTKHATKPATNSLFGTYTISEPPFGNQEATNSLFLDPSYTVCLNNPSSSIHQSDRAVDKLSQFIQHTDSVEGFITGTTAVATQTDHTAISPHIDTASSQVQHNTSEIPQVQIFAQSQMNTAITPHIDTASSQVQHNTSEIPQVQIFAQSQLNTAITPHIDTASAQSQLNTAITPHIDTASAQSQMNTAITPHIDTASAQSQMNTAITPHIDTASAQSQMNTAISPHIDTASSQVQHNTSEIPQVQIFAQSQLNTAITPHIDTASSQVQHNTSEIPQVKIFAQSQMNTAISPHIDTASSQVQHNTSEIPQVKIFAQSQMNTAISPHIDTASSQVQHNTSEIPQVKIFAQSQMNTAITPHIDTASAQSQMNTAITPHIDTASAQSQMNTAITPHIDTASAQSQLNTAITPHIDTASAQSQLNTAITPHIDTASSQVQLNTAITPHIDTASAQSQMNTAISPHIDTASAQSQMNTAISPHIDTASSQVQHNTSEIPQVKIFAQSQMNTAITPHIDTASAQSQMNTAISPHIDTASSQVQHNTSEIPQVKIFAQSQLNTAISPHIDTASSQVQHNTSEIPQVKIFAQSQMNTAISPHIDTASSQVQHNTSEIPQVKIFAQSQMNTAISPHIDTASSQVQHNTSEIPQVKIFAQSQLNTAITPHIDTASAQSQVNTAITPHIDTASAQSQLNTAITPHIDTASAQSQLNTAITPHIDTASAQSQLNTAITPHIDTASAQVQLNTAITPHIDTASAQSQLNTAITPHIDTASAQVQLNTAVAPHIESSIQRHLFPKHIATQSDSDPCISAHTRCVPLIKLSDISLGQEIGMGAFGTVFEGIWLKTKVAVKVISMKRLKLIKHSLLREISLHSQLRHPNIVLLMAYTLESNKLYLVTELIQGDTLDDVLFGGKSKSLTMPEKFTVAEKICLAVVYLHSQTPVIIHRDIKPENILISHDLKQVKLCDMGLSKFKTMNTVMTTMAGGLAQPGTPVFQAPEILLHKKSANILSDLWSLSCTLVELISESPIWNLPDDLETPVHYIMEHMNVNAKPDGFRALKLVANIKLCQILEAGLSYKANERPQAAEIVDCLHSL